MLYRRRALPLVALLLASAVVLAAAPAARAGANNCMYDGRDYPEGVVICQAGLLNLCMNGVWQTKGSFCNETPDGAIMGGAAAPVVIEEPAAVVEDD